MNTDRLATATAEVLADLANQARELAEAIRAEGQHCPPTQLARLLIDADQWRTTLGEHQDRLYWTLDPAARGAR
ncbi:MAG: hypothetical protein JNM56_33060 [Planctomycetia bacterium]|nr:hypothetical protein [Planctomycetia bacterium]